MRHIELQLPPYARSTDPSLLACQPTKAGRLAAIADRTETGGSLVAMHGLRIRLTDVDKDRGFVSGALAEVEHVLRKDVFVTPTGR